MPCGMNPTCTPSLKYTVTGGYQKLRRPAVRSGQGADIRFLGECLAEGIPFPRAYVMLYSICMLLEDARDFYSNAQSLGLEADERESVHLFLTREQRQDEITLPNPG